MAIGPDRSPVSVTGAVRGGHAYYPFREERIRAVDAGRGVSVHSYATIVLRDDGLLLEPLVLPHAPGTPPHMRVHALTDGTRIHPPRDAGTFATWSIGGIRAYVEAARQERPLSVATREIWAMVEAALRERVWLPVDDGYALATAFVMLSYCYRAFGALPLLLVSGPPQSGKSELGLAIASLAFNGTVVGHATRASLSRMSELTGGLIVLDDLEGLGGRGGGDPDLQQLLKIGYKAATASRAVVEQSGRLRVIDLFGPRVVTNVSGAEPALRSRMVRIATSAPLPGVNFQPQGPAEPCSQELRDGLHAWGLSISPRIDTSDEASVGAGRLREIAAPLLVVASLAGEGARQRVANAIEQGEREPISIRSDQVLARALSRIVARGMGEQISMIQIAMEVALVCLDERIHQSRELGNPEWIGARLVAEGLRGSSDRPERRRLHGRIVRIYRVAPGWLAATGHGPPAASDPFAFCTDTACSACPYEMVCAQVAPGLKERRSRSR